MINTTPKRPVLRYHGGKWLLAKWIISHFPPHRVYVELFGGAGSLPPGKNYKADDHTNQSPQRQFP